MDTETLVWIWGGVLLFLWICLSIWLLVVTIKLSNLAQRTTPQPAQPIPFGRAGNGRSQTGYAESVNSFGTAGIMPGEELSQRGFSKHGPSAQRGYNNSNPRSPTTPAGNRDNSANYGGQPSFLNQNYPRSNNRNDNFMY